MAVRSGAKEASQHVRRIRKEMTGGGVCGLRTDSRPQHLILFLENIRGAPVFLTRRVSSFLFFFV